MADKDEIAEKADAMRAANANAFDNMFEAFRQAGMLIESTPEEWDAYIYKNFGESVKRAAENLVNVLGKTDDKRGNDPADLGFKERHEYDPLEDKNA